MRGKVRGLFAHALIILQGLLRGHEKEMLHNVVVLIEHIHSGKRLLIFGTTSCYYIQLLKPLELVWEG